MRLSKLDPFISRHIVQILAIFIICDCVLWEGVTDLCQMTSERIVAASSCMTDGSLSNVTVPYLVV